MTTDRGPDTGSSETAVTFERLLDLISRGDQQAFSELYDRTAPRVLGLVKRVLVDHAQSEEVAQEVFLEIWRTASRFESQRGSAMSWILTMSHRRAVDRVRSSQSGHDRDERIGLRDIEPEYDEVSETVEIRIEHERVKRAMAQLTALQREAISLAYYGGYSHTEIAGILSIPVGTVKTRLRDGMIRLRDELGVTS
ncbi:sigma-70 family RNA polymerase sigma factor [Herbiconiux sp. CPCC 205763]|uniref:Sigma-70 family RNA polymerase sigma factor n=1 Tax=Herbiconiux aconitum TaxID=2970913 RepID=A0ABT2GQ15_9MICO|nr:sigma-70 family RNA polymerase sigma factor [Herbiconiux aconitum]MCS5718314.1 sigma-70 family RNA polymerase sigma factor [Herbiconiux aconitum]